MTITIYGNSLLIYARKVLVCLIEKAIEYELELVNPIAASDWFADVSPMGKIPCFEIAPSAPMRPCRIRQSFAPSSKISIRNQRGIRPNLSPSRAAAHHSAPERRHNRLSTVSAMSRHSIAPLAQIARVT